MLKDMLNHKDKLSIGGKEYKVCFSLNSMLFLELCGLSFSFILSIPYEKWDIDTVLLLVKACLCSLPQNADAVERRDFDAVSPTLFELGQTVRADELPELRKQLFHIIENAFPPPDEQQTERKTAEATDEGHMRAIYCDVMHRPDAEFWSNTYRTNLYRINHYLEAKGMKEKPVEIQKYDKED